MAQHDSLASLNKEYNGHIERLEVNNKLLSHQNELYLNKIAENDLLVESMESEFKKFKEDAYVKLKEAKSKVDKILDSSLKTDARVFYFVSCKIEWRIAAWSGHDEQ